MCVFFFFFFSFQAEKVFFASSCFCFSSLFLRFLSCWICCGNASTKTQRDSRIRMNSPSLALPPSLTSGPTAHATCLFFFFPSALKHEERGALMAEDSAWQAEWYSQTLSQSCNKRKTRPPALESNHIGKALISLCPTCYHFAIVALRSLLVCHSLISANTRNCGRVADASAASQEDDSFFFFCCCSSLVARKTSDDILFFLVVHSFVVFARFVFGVDALRFFLCFLFSTVFHSNTTTDIRALFSASARFLLLFFLSLP